jgi:hypothetical protein
VEVSLEFGEGSAGVVHVAAGVQLGAVGQMQVNVHGGSFLVDD